MKFRRIAGLGAIGVFVLAGALFTPGSSQASPVRASPAPPTRAEAYAAGIRAQLGLESDLPYIRSLESQPGLNDTDLGTPVTAPELAELNARRALVHSEHSEMAAFARRRQVRVHALSVVSHAQA